MPRAGTLTDSERGPYADGHTATMVRKYLDRTGLSQRELAVAAEQAGFSVLSHAYVSKLLRGLVLKIPDAPFQEALAGVLKVPAFEVRRAVILDWWGWDLADSSAGSSRPSYDDPRVDLMMELLSKRLTRMSARDRRVLVDEIMDRYVVMTP